MVKPMETWRGDPFLPIGYKPRVGPKVTPPIRDFPFERLFPHQRKKGKGGRVAEIQQPSRRMAGILLGDRVYAILDTAGDPQGPQIVQPGEYTRDRLAIVQKIEPDKIVLKTVDEKPRYVTVRMAASPTVTTMPSASPSPEQPRRAVAVYSSRRSTATTGSGSSTGHGTIDCGTLLTRHESDQMCRDDMSLGS